MTTTMYDRRQYRQKVGALLVGVALLASGCRLKGGLMYDVYNTGLNGVAIPIFAIPTNQIGTLHKVLSNGDYNKTADWLLDNVPLVTGNFSITDPFGGIDGVAEWHYGLSDGGQRADLGTELGYLINVQNILVDWNSGRNCLEINKWLDFPSGWHQNWTTTQDAISHHCPPGTNMAL